MTEIKGFFGPYRFLSNFWKCQIVYRGVIFYSVEAAFQAAKTTTNEDFNKFILLSPRDAKQLGRSIKLKPDWELTKLSTMLELTRVKYQIPGLRLALINTGGAYLEETNTWGDVFWGVYNGKGSNALGKILMKVRSEILVQQNVTPLTK